MPDPTGPLMKRPRGSSGDVRLRRILRDGQAHAARSRGRTPGATRVSGAAAGRRFTPGKTDPKPAEKSVRESVKIRVPNVRGTRLF